MSVSSDEVNLLVYRYLLESGFGHSAFTFASESGVAKSPLATSDVPQGSLITLLQKGLQYVEVETHITDKGEAVQCTQPFSIVSKHKCSSKKRKAALNDSAALAADVANDDDNDDDVAEWLTNEVVKLEGHDSEVFVCSWHPSADFLATGSGDATARLWHVPRNVSTQQAVTAAVSTVKVLRHHSAGNTKSRDVTTLDWNRNGSLLATASYDGVARIWKSDGDLLKELVGHKGPIFALKWNKSGSHLLSGSFDKTAVIWDATTGSLRQQFAFHSAPTLDVDWRSDTSFASCSTDKHILVCELGRNAPLNDFVGHADEVNAITWDATGRLLASCSDDRTAKLWNCDSTTAVATLSEHSKEIYTIEWAPTGAGTANPSARPLLASASFDTTIKLWDPETQACVRTLAKHTDPVYSVSFSPDGQYLASGSLDKCVNIWSVRDGTLLRRYRGGGGIFEVRWNAAGDRLGACFADKSVVVIDVRKL